MAENKADIKVLKPEMKTDPHVYYIGLPDAFVHQVDGQGGAAGRRTLRREGDFHADF